MYHSVVIIVAPSLLIVLANLESIHSEEAPKTIVTSDHHIHPSPPAGHGPHPGPGPIGGGGGGHNHLVMQHMFHHFPPPRMSSPLSPYMSHYGPPPSFYHHHHHHGHSSPPPGPFEMFPRSVTHSSEPYAQPRLAPSTTIYHHGISLPPIPPPLFDHPSSPPSSYLLDDFDLPFAALGDDTTKHQQHYGGDNPTRIILKHEQADQKDEDNGYRATTRRRPKTSKRPRRKHRRKKEYEDYEDVGGAYKVDVDEDVDDDNDNRQYYDPFDDETNYLPTTGGRYGPERKPPRLRKVFVYDVDEFDESARRRRRDG